MEYVIAITTGVLASFLASLLFLYFMAKFKPKIEISPYISQGTTEDGKTVYRVKIINRSPRPAINIRVQFLLRIKKNVPDGMLINNQFLNLKTDKMFEISEFNTNDKTAGYAKRFVCHDNIEEIWDDRNGAYLTFRLIATDSISGFQKVFKHSYYTKRTDIKEGSHRFGNSLDVA